MRRFGPADHAQEFDLDPVVFLTGFLIADEGQKVVLEHLFLPVCQSLEPYEDVLQLVVGQFITQFLEFRPQSRTPRVLAHDDVGFLQADVLGPHDLERLGVLEHAVLMDAAFVSEGVLAHDGLVVLHRKARDRGNAARDVHQLRRVDAGVIGHDVVANLHGHHDLFQGCVAGTLAQSVDRAFDLPGAALDGCQRVGRRHAEVVVAMGGKDHLLGAGHFGNQAADQLGAFVGRSVADGVGDIDRGRPRPDSDLDHTGEIVPFGPGGIHR